jgi:hypothetical protein
MTNPVIPPIARPGIRPQFPRVKTYIKKFYERDFDPWQHSSKGLLTLERYAKHCLNADSESANDEPRVDFYAALSALGPISRAIRLDALKGAFEDSGDWRTAWQRSVAYEYWSYRIEFPAELRRFEYFQSGAVAHYHGQMSLEGLGNNIGDCLAMGWHEWSVDLAQRTYRVLDRDGCFDDNDWGRRRTQHFILRLIGDWQGWPKRTGPTLAFDEPIFNALVDHWRTPNPEDLAPMLLAASDRHTHQARWNAKTGAYDFSRWDFWYDPIEILAVLRLREMHGLQNPVLDHMVIATPLGNLYASPPLYADDLLNGVLTEARREYANL